MIGARDNAWETKLEENPVAQFDMIDLAKLKCIIGIEIAYSKKGIIISQRKHVLDLPRETGKIDCKATKAPLV